jgi:hypothetical protein
MKTFKKIAFLLLACVATGIFASSCKSGSEKGSSGSGEADLKLNFKPGDKFLYSTKIDQKISLTQMSMDQSMLMEMVYAYTGEDSGNKKLTITYDHIVMNMTSPMGSMVYDSKNPKNNEKEMGAALDNLIGKSFSISVAPDGKIVKTEGLEDLIKSQSNSLGASNEITGQFSDTVVKQMMQTSFDIFPGKVVKVGESWSKKSQMGFSGMSVNVENTYVLKSVEGNKATIAMTSEMNLPKSDKDTAAALVQMTGKQEGTIDIDISSGQIISGKTTQDIKGTMNVMNQQIPMNIKGNIVISSKRL